MIPERTEAAGAELRRVLHGFIARRVRDPDTADDLTQEVMLKAHRAGMDPAEVGDVAAWLYRIARNTLVDHYRHRDRHPAPGQLPAELVALELDSDADEARHQLARCLRPMVEQLDPIYREAITLTDLGGLSQAEAARRSGVTGSTMKSRVQRARAQLGEAVRACCAVHVDVTGEGPRLRPHPRLLQLITNPQGEPAMPTTRIQLALNVDDVAAATDFYTKLFGVGPHKVRPGYANFAVEDPPLKLVLFENADAEQALNHIGIEAPSVADVTAADERFRSAGLVTRSITDDLCCHAVQDKVFVTAPGVPHGWWEYYAVTDDDPDEDADRPATQCCAAPAEATSGCC